jgi:hypothetical protein
MQAEQNTLCSQIEAQTLVLTIESETSWSQFEKLKSWYMFLFYKHGDVSTFMLVYVDDIWWVLKRT